MPIRKKLVSAENSEKFSRHFLKRKNCIHCFFYCWRRQNRRLLSNKSRWLQSKRSDSFFWKTETQQKSKIHFLYLYCMDLIWENKKWNYIASEILYWRETHSSIWKTSTVSETNQFSIFVHHWTQWKEKPR